MLYICQQLDTSLNESSSTLQASLATATLLLEKVQTLLGGWKEAFWPADAENLSSTGDDSEE